MVFQPDVSLREFSKSGIPGYEPSVNKPEDLRLLAPLLKKHNIEMRLLYGLYLHKEREAKESLEKGDINCQSCQMNQIRPFVQCRKG